MKKILKLIFVAFLVFAAAAACTPKETEDKTIENLIVVFVPSRDPGLILTQTEPLKQLLIDALGTRGYTVNEVTIEVSTDYNAAGEALAAGTAHVGFLPGGTYALYSEDNVEVILAATRAGLNKDSENAKDWNDGLETLGDSANQVTYYRSLIYAGPSEIGRAIAAKVNAGTALTWDDVNNATWCYSNSTTSSAGYVYPTMWLLDNFDKKLTDLTKPAITGSYSVIANNLATGLCDVGVGYADIRRDYKGQWTTDWGRTAEIWVETDVIGVTEGIFNDTISVGLENPEMSEGFKTALQEAFIEIAKTPAGAEAIKIYNHEGYKVVTDADYDGARRAQELVSGN
ncbi:MAG: phosphate/phosphite/phosphonate ABC transporter substrate-binding protein [Erysipelothrix sp.]|nr:phosphate/phosphite/phosphonate ABC transporter substrate-binding protein [Erysipelothrix sp.]